MKTTEEIFKDLQPFIKRCNESDIFKDILLDNYRLDVIVLKVNQNIHPNDEGRYTVVKTLEVFENSDQKLLKIAGDLEYNIKRVMIIDLYDFGRSAVAVSENGDEYIITYN